VDVIFNYDSQVNLIAEDLVSKLVFEVHDHHNPYPLEWVNKDANLKVTKQCNIKFAISENFINEEELYVVPLDVCCVVFESP